MKCTYHPNVETNLSCGKCGRPICPKCMVQTPVGARCPDCAKVVKLPTYHLSARHYLIATGTALAMAIASGIVWWIVRAFVPFIFIDLLLAGVVGYAIGEVVSRSVNLKRGNWLALIGAAAIPVSYLVGIAINTLFTYTAAFHPLDILAIAIGIFVAVIRLR
jgi:hypothetical protein